MTNELAYLLFGIAIGIITGACIYALSAEWRKQR